MREDPLASAVIVLHQTPPRFTPAPMGMSIPALRRIFGALLDRGYRFVGLREVGPEGAYPGSIAVTADDGYASQQRHLRPFLRELGVPWTVFVLAGMLGKKNDWDHPWVSQRDWHLTPDDVRRLAGEGVTIGSHGMTHVNMTALPDAALEEELTLSRETLGELSGQAVDAVAFPWGLSDERVAGAARRAGYRLGFGADVGRATDDAAIRAAASSYLIPRLGLYGPDQLFPAFAAAAIGHSHPLRAVRSGLERLGQGLVGLAMAAKRGPVFDGARRGLLVALLLLASLGTLAAARDGSPPPTGPVADSLSAGDGGGTPVAAQGVARASSDSTAGGPSADPGLAVVPWKIGEYFQFSIDWNGLNGGNSLMQVQNIQRLDGRRVYRIVTKAESNSFVSKFYKVRDRAESYIDAESLYSRRFVKHLREGGYKKDSDVRFDQEARKAAYDDGSSMDVPARVHDVLSAFYYVRTQPLPNGATLLLPTHDNKKSYDMEVKVHRRERVQVPAGSFDCVVVEPMLKSEGVFKSKGSILVWLSDDEHRIPVMVKSKVPVGSISVSLTDMRLSFQAKR